MVLCLELVRKRTVAIEMTIATGAMRTVAMRTMSMRIARGGASGRQRVMRIP